MGIHLQVVHPVGDFQQLLQVHVVVNVQQLFVCIQLPVVRLKHLDAGAAVKAVAEHQLQQLGHTGEVDAGTGGGACAAGDHVGLAVVVQRLEAAGGGLQASAGGPGPGVIDGHAFRLVVTQHVVHAALVVHDGGVAKPQLDALGHLQQEALRRLFIVEQGEGGLGGLAAHTGLNDQVLQRVDSRQTVVAQAAEGEVIEGVAGEHAAGNAGGGEALDGGDLNAVQLQQLDDFLIGGGAVGDVLLVPGVEDLAQTADGLAGVGVFVDHAVVAHQGQVQGLTEGLRLLVGDVVGNRGDVQVFLLLDLVGLMGGQELCALCVVLDPLGNALGDGLAGHVVVAAAHAEDAVVAGLTQRLCDLLVAQLDDLVKAVFQGNVVVDDLAALGDGPGVKHDQHGVAIAGPLLVVRAGLGQTGGDALNRAVVPVLGNLYQAGDFFAAKAELLCDRNHVAEILGDVAAACAHNGNCVRCGHGGRVNAGHHGFGSSVEEGCVNPGEAEGAAEVAGLVAEEQLTGENGGRHVAQCGSLGLCPADLSDVAVVFPPDTVVPVGVLHIDGVLHHVVDVDQLGEAGRGFGNDLISKVCNVADIQSASFQDFLNFCFVTHSIPPCSYLAESSLGKLDLILSVF